MTDDLKKQLAKAILDNADKPQKKVRPIFLILLIIALLAPLALSQYEPHVALQTYPIIESPAQPQIQPAILNNEQAPPTITYTGAPGFHAFAGCSFTGSQRPSNQIDNQDQHRI